MHNTQSVIKVYPCFCIQMDTKTWIPYISFVHKYIYARIEIKCHRYIWNHFIFLVVV